MPAKKFCIIGDKLHSFRKRTGMTQAEVAEAAGISDRTYADIERGSVNMRVDTMLRICKVLRITPDEILVTKSYDTDTIQETVLQKLDDCSHKEKQTALRILEVYLDSLN